jgi:hypothetical protein
MKIGFLSMLSAARKFYQIEIEREDGGTHSFAHASKNFTETFGKIEKSLSPISVEGISTISVTLEDKGRVIRCYE